MLSKKINRIFILATVALIMLVGYCFAKMPHIGFGNTATVQAAEQTQSTLKVVSLADTHVLPRNMIKDTKDYQDALNSDRKMFTESSAILDAMLAEIKTLAPDVLTISGDLTKDGEREAHEYLAEKLAKLKAELPNLNVYVINGNHDIRNSNAYNYNTESGEAVSATRTEPADFKSIYAELTYNNAYAKYTPPAGKEAGSLSYVARPKEGYTFIAIDTGRYSADNTESGLNEHETSGAISDHLKEWVTAQIKEAKLRGDTVVGVQHHGMVPHFSLEPTLLPMYLVNDYQSISEQFADAGMNYILTGHMHANDISMMETAKHNKMYDIETGSAVTYPCPIRTIDISRVQDGANIVDTLKIDTATQLKNVTFSNLSEEDVKIDNLSDYAKAHGFTEDMISTIASGVVGTLFQTVINGGGLETVVEGLLKDLLGMDMSLKQMILALPSMLPTDTESAFYYDENKNAITVSAKGLKFDININGIYGALHSLFAQADSIMQKDPNVFDKVMPKFVSGIINMAIAEDGSQKKSLLDLANYAYQAHLAGLDGGNDPSWVTAATAGIADGTVVTNLLSTLVDGAMDLVMEFTKQVNLSEILGIYGMQLAIVDGSATFGGFVPLEGRNALIAIDEENKENTGAAFMMLFMSAPGASIENATKIVNITKITTSTFLSMLEGLVSIPDLLKETLLGTPAVGQDPGKEGLVNTEMKQQIGGLLNSIIGSLAKDDNYIQDNKTTLSSTIVMPATTVPDQEKPEDKPKSGCGSMLANNGLIGGAALMFVCLSALLIFISLRPRRIGRRR